MELEWIEGRCQMAESGGSRIQITCPCCGLTQWAAIWSLAGSGKRCENKKCRAMFDYIGRKTTPNLIMPEAASGR